MNIQIKGLFFVLFFVFVVGESGLLADDKYITADGEIIRKAKQQNSGNCPLFNCDVIERALIFLYEKADEEFEKGLKDFGTLFCEHSHRLVDLIKETDSKELSLKSVFAEFQKYSKNSDFKKDFKAHRYYKT